MNNSAIEVMKEISGWCFENNSETFTCFFSYSAHVETAGIKLISGGYDHPREFFERDYLRCEPCPHDGDDAVNILVKNLIFTFDGMKEFKAEHDKWFSIENQESMKEAKKLRRIESIKLELEKLEG